MAVPTVVGVGAVASAGASVSITPAFPAGIADNDILVTALECNEVDVFSTPTDWAHVTGSPVVPTGGLTRLTVFWRRYVSTDVAPSYVAADHSVGRMIAVRGCKTSGNPWNAVNTGTEAAGDATAEFPGTTTTVNDCLMLEIIATGLDSATTTNLGALTNAAYTDIVEQMDNWVAVTGGGGIGMVSATMATAGATGQSAATMGGTQAKALMTLALEPVAVAASSPATNRMLLGVG